MNAIKFLFAAYIATWVIHGVYLGSLVRRFSRLRQELREVGKGKQAAPHRRG
jgi:CcmD family protein